MEGTAHKVARGACGRFLAAASQQGPLTQPAAELRGAAESPAQAERFIGRAVRVAEAPDFLRQEEVAQYDGGCRTAGPAAAMALTFVRDREYAAARGGIKRLQCGIDYPRRADETQGQATHVPLSRQAVEAFQAPGSRWQVVIGVPRASAREQADERDRSLALYRWAISTRP